jgi:3-methyladenine DNA glycosylase AlkD
LAQVLWDSGIHEARILASMVDEPARVTSAQMDCRAADFNSWDLCDQCCSNLFDKTLWAWEKAAEWSAAEEPFVKRAGFVMMAVLAVHDKQADNERFLPFFDIIERGSGDTEDRPAGGTTRCSMMDLFENRYKYILCRKLPMGCPVSR